MIEIKNLSKIYNNDSSYFKALENINLVIEKGEFVTIMGPSGIGKSTLMNILGLLDNNFNGEYRLNTINTNEFNDNELSKYRNKTIGFIFQNFNLLNKLSVARNIELPLIYAGERNKKLRKEIVINSLEKVGLLKQYYNRPSQFSGGQRQRTAIARALVNNPDIILADEPTGALDSKNGKDIMNIFKKLNSEGKTIIVITHDLNVASFGKRIINILDGIIIS